MKLNIINTWQQIRNQNIVWDSITTTIWNVIGSGLGLLVPFFIAAWFGVGVKTDIFFFIYGFILYLTGIFTHALQSNVVPFVTKIKSEREEETSIFINKLLALALLVTTALTVIFIIFAKPIFAVITNFPHDSQGLLLQLFVEVSPLMILLVLSSILAGILNAYFKFWLPAISPGIRAVICIVVIWGLKERFGIHAVALGYISGEAVRFLIFMYILMKNKILSLRLNFHFDSEIMMFLKVLSFQVVSMIAIGLNPLVDKAMASWLSIGSVSILQYADRIYFIPITLISSGLIVVILSHWSDRYHRHKKIGILKQDMHKVIAAVAVISVILTFFLSIFSRQIINIAYGRGKFPLGLIGEVRITFLFYLAGITFYLIGQVIVRAHLVLKNTKTLMKTAFISTVLNIIFNLIFMHFWGVKGIAFATTITSAAILFYLYRTFDLISKRGLVFDEA